MDNIENPRTIKIGRISRYFFWKTSEKFHCSLPSAISFLVIFFMLNALEKYVVNIFLKFLHVNFDNNL